MALLSWCLLDTLLSAWSLSDMCGTNLNLYRVFSVLSWMLTMKLKPGAFQIDDDKLQSWRQNPAAYTQILNLASRGLQRFVFDILFCLKCNIVNKRQVVPIIQAKALKG